MGGTAMSDREKRLEEIQEIISARSAQFPEGGAERLSEQFANMMADDAWEDDDELPSLVALDTFLRSIGPTNYSPMLPDTDAMPGIGTNGRGSITAFWRYGNMTHCVDFLPTGEIRYSSFIHTGQEGEQP